MAEPKIAREKVECIAAGIFIISLLTLAYFDYHHLAAGIAASFGISVVIRQLIYGRILDLVIAAIIFGGIFISLYWKLEPDTVVTTLLVIGSIYYIISQIRSYRHRRHSTGSGPVGRSAQLNIDERDEH